MAKFNIEVDLDWFEEDGSLDDSLKAEIASGIIAKVSCAAIADVEKKVQAKIEEIDAQVIQKTNDAISEKLAECLDDFLHKPRTITDKWGDPKKKGVSVVDMLKAACDNYIEQEVDYQGNASSGYSGKQKRIDYIIGKLIDTKMKKAVDDACEKVSDALESYVEDSIREKLTDNISKAIGLDHIVQGMK